MHKISVIIPFFQQEPGILSRALDSIACQHVPENWSVEVIVVDDGSPCPADDEVRDLQFAEQLHLKVVRQDNAGVGAARNRGLEETDTSATLIAFLDSDDSWCPDHLARAIEAHEMGFDLYFTDNRRHGYHSSYVHSPYCAETGRFIAAAQHERGILAIPTDYAVGLILKEFPTQASSVVYKRGIAPLLRFNTRLKRAGEDVLFFTALATKASRVAFDLDSYVECGSGVNIFYKNLSWDSPQFLAIKLDQLLAHRLVANTIMLSPSNKEWNDEHVVTRRRDLAYHILRNLVKHPTRVPKVISRLIRLDPGAVLSLAVDMVHATRVAVVGSKQIK